MIVNYLFKTKEHKMTWNCNCVFKPYLWTAKLTRTWWIIQDISYNSDRFWQWQNDTQCRIKGVTVRIILQLIIFCAPLGMHRTTTAICFLILTPWCLSHSKLHAKSIRMWKKGNTGGKSKFVLAPSAQQFRWEIVFTLPAVQDYSKSLIFVKVTLCCQSRGQHSNEDQSQGISDVCRLFSQAQVGTDYKLLPVDALSES